VVLDKEDRDVLRIANAPDLPAQDIDLVMVEARGRLVEKQKLGPAGESACKLDALLDRKRQTSGRQMHERLQVHESDELERAVRYAPLFLLPAGKPEGVGDEAGRRAAVAADLHVVEHCHAVEQRHVLERAADAELGNDVPGLGEDRAAFEQDIAVVGNVEPRQAIEEGGLACAVRADQPGDLAGRDVEADAVERYDAAEAHRDGPYAQHGIRADAGDNAHCRCRNHGRRFSPNHCYWALDAPHVGLSDRRWRRY
jgi:hypothetical protein